MSGADNHCEFECIRKGEPHPECQKHGMEREPSIEMICAMGNPLQTRAAHASAAPERLTAVAIDFIVDDKAPGRSRLRMADDDVLGQWYRKADADRLVAAKDAEIEQLKGITPELPPFPADDMPGLPRYGLRWNGPTSPLAVPLNDGYWTPWHLANKINEENAQLRESLRIATDEDKRQVEEISKLREQLEFAQKQKAFVVEQNTQLREQLCAYPADWRTDSSLETWFPISAMMLEDRQTEINQLREQLERSQALLKSTQLERQHFSNTCEGAQMEIMQLRDRLATIDKTLRPLCLDLGRSTESIAIIAVSKLARREIHLRQKSEQISRLQSAIEDYQKGSSENVKPLPEVTP